MISLDDLYYKSKFELYQRCPPLGCKDIWFIFRNWWIIRGGDGSWAAGGDDDERGQEDGPWEGGEDPSGTIQSHIKTILYESLIYRSWS